MAAHGKRLPTLRSDRWPAGRRRSQRWVYNLSAIVDGARSAIASAASLARSTSASRYGRRVPRRAGSRPWRDPWPTLSWPSRRRPWITERDRLWGDGVGRAFEVVVFAVVATAVLGAGAAYVIQQTSSTESTQSEPLPWPEIDLSLPTPPPYPTPSPSEPAGGPASATPTPKPSKPVKPRPTAAKPRPKPPAKPRVPVRLLLEAESSQHQFSGNTRPRSNNAASGDFVVGWLGNGSRNRLGLSVTVPDADRYMVTFFYISGDYRDAVVSVNGGAGTWIEFPATEDWATVRTLVLQLPLRAGQNTIELSNPDYYGPDIDRIMVIR